MRLGYETCKPKGEHTYHRLTLVVGEKPDLEACREYVTKVAKRLWPDTDHVNLSDVELDTPARLLGVQSDE